VIEIGSDKEISLNFLGTTITFELRASLTTSANRVPMSPVDSPRAYISTASPFACVRPAAADLSEWPMDKSIGWISPTCPHCGKLIFPWLVERQPRP